MRKNTERRGRPGLNPRIDDILLCRVLEEQAKPPEKRTQVNIMAHELREEIIRTSSKDERPPAVSTLEKRISKLRSTINVSLEDKPWSIFTLGHYPIPPEAIPKVLKEYGRLLASQHTPSPYITIRQAKWIGRLSATKSFERWPNLYLLVSLAEQILEWLGDYPLSSERLLKLLAERSKFTLVDQALAEMEAGDAEGALILYDACKSWIYQGYGQISIDKGK